MGSIIGASSSYLPWAHRKSKRLHLDLSIPFSISSRNSLSTALRHLFSSLGLAATPLPEEYAFAILKAAFTEEYLYFLSDLTAARSDSSSFSSHSLSNLSTASSMAATVFIPSSPDSMNAS